MLRKWVTFNAVGVLGFAVQLATLTLLLSSASGWHYVPATAAAVEAAVLHNFVWHQLVTWRDRPADSAATLLKRLLDFHMLNGTVSLIGNVGIVALLAGAFGVHPIAANIAAVAVCSLLNFVGSEVLVFRTAPALLLLLLPPAAGAAHAGSVVMADLKPHTVAAWKKYEQPVDQRLAGATASGTPFFAHDAYGRDGGWRQRVIDGAVEMFQAGKPAPGSGDIDVPDGKIHHWVGAIFIPGTTLDGVLGTLQGNAGREKNAYKEIIDSRLLERDGNRLRVYMKVQRDATVTTVTYNTEHLVEYRRLGDRRATQRSTAVRINELENAGTAREREKPQGNDSGYLWRWNAYWRYEEVQGGVLVECESVSLSRSVPLIVRPIVNPIANGLARESLHGTLTTLRSLLAAGSRDTAE